jgi:hypothetical protein
MAERQYPHPMPREGIAGTVTELVDDVQRLVELEIELLQLELRELAIRNGIAIGLLATGALGVLFALIFLQVALVTALPFPAWLNALGVVVFWLIVAAILFYVGRARIKIEAPEKTIQSIKEDLEWVKQQIRLITK